MKIKLYARTDENGIVIKFLNTLLDDKEILETDVFLDEGYGDDFAYPHIRYVLYDKRYILNYKIIDGMVIERTPEEKQQEIDARPPPPKSELQIMRETMDLLVIQSLGVN